MRNYFNGDSQTAPVPLASLQKFSLAEYVLARGAKSLYIGEAFSSSVLISEIQMSTILNDIRGYKCFKEAPRPPLLPHALDFRKHTNRT